MTKITIQEMGIPTSIERKDRKTYEFQLTMEFYNNFVDTNFSNENYGNNAVSTATPLKFSNEIYPPSPSSSPIYNNHSYMTDIYNIKMEQLVSPESYGVPPSPPDSYQSIASPKLNID
uniref:Uncharacterized protein n=1 Tax=Megaselia scalaris TaxID=36166 RepID=T1H4W3_MEGSC